MTGIIIFAVALVLVGFLLRVTGSWYYDKVYGKEETVAVVPAEEDTDELIAVISAAIADDIQGQVVVRKITPFHDETDSAWARTGKLNIMSSHTVQPKR